MPIEPESRNIGGFYKGKQAVVEDVRNVPPPTRYDSYTPAPKKPDPPMDFSTRLNREGESKKHPDPAGAWGPGKPGESDKSLTSVMFFADGYSGHPAAHRYDAGEENLSMATRLAKRRQASIERRFNERCVLAAMRASRDTCSPRVMPTPSHLRGELHFAERDCPRSLTLDIHPLSACADRPCLPQCRSKETPLRGER